LTATSTATDGGLQKHYRVFGEETLILRNTKNFSVREKLLRKKLRTPQLGRVPHCFSKAGCVLFSDKLFGKFAKTSLNNF